jgi:hypothetical protein
MNRGRFRKLDRLWDKSDDEMLLMQHNNGLPLQEIAAYHRRTEEAIKQRIKFLLLHKKRGNRI